MFLEQVSASKNLILLKQPLIDLFNQRLFSLDLYNIRLLWRSLLAFSGLLRSARKANITT
jgi:hypothetical protein